MRAGGLSVSMALDDFASATRLVAPHRDASGTTPQVLIEL